MFNRVILALITEVEVPTEVVLLPHKLKAAAATVHRVVTVVIPL